MSFRLKTILGIALIELVLLAILVVSGLGWLKDSNEQQIITNGERLSETFAIAVRDAIIATDLANLRAFTQEAIRDGDIAYIHVLDDQGQLLAQSSNLSDAGIPPDYTELPSASSDGIYDIRHDIAIEGYHVGHIEFGLDVSAFSQLIENAKNYAVSIAALEVVLVALFSFVFGSLLTKRLLTLQHGALQIQQNGPGETIPVKGRDEVAQVTNAFNEMSVTLSHTYEELSQEKNRYKQLAYQNKMLAAIVEQSHEAYLIIDREGKISLSNQAMYGLIGYSEPEIQGKDFQTVLFGEHTPEESAYQLREAINNGNTLTLRAVCLSQSGQSVQTDITAFPISDNQGEHELYVLIVRDASERHEFEQMLKQAADVATQATNAKSQFLANMSHELRTPMNGILGMAEMLKTSPLNKEQLHFADIIYSSTQDLLQLINDILDFSKLEAKKLKLDHSRFCLRHMVEDVAYLTSVTASQKNLSVIVDIPPALHCDVISDELRLRQVLNNLLGNAVKFTESGYIRVTVRGEEDTDSETTRFSISVEDTGIGIRPDKLKDVTKAFEQADNSTTRRYEGTGLGLSITESLLGLFGSHLEVESELDKGSKFTFSLTMPSFAEQENLEGALAGKRIAIVHAEPMLRPIFDSYFAYWQASHTYLSTLDLLEESKIRFDAAVVMLNDETDIAPEPYCPWIGVVANVHQLDGHYSDYDQRLIAKPLRMEQLLQELQLSMVEEPSFAPSAPAEGKETQMPLKELSLIVVDDVEYNREVIRIYLAGIADNMILSEGGQDALEQIKKRRFDILITDISMPDIDGYELTEKLRQFEQSHNLPSAYVIGLSAHASSEDHQRAMQAGMDAYLTKPVSRAALIDALNKAANQRAAVISG